MMQQRDQETDAPDKPHANGGEGRRADILARQKRFALILTGDEQTAQELVIRISSMEDARADRSVSASALQFIAFKKLYNLWMAEGQKEPLLAPLFQPGREHEAVQQGLDPAIARIMGGLPSLHRALLLLIYGESFSYAATAQLFDISIEQLMSALALARQDFVLPEKIAGSVSERQAAGAGFEGAHDTAV